MDNTDDINVGDIDNEFSLGDGINEMGAEGEDDMRAEGEDDMRAEGEDDMGAEGEDDMRAEGEEDNYNPFDPVKNMEAVKNKITTTTWASFGFVFVMLLVANLIINVVVYMDFFGIGKYKYYIDIYFVWLAGLILLFTLLKPWAADGISNVKKDEGQVLAAGPEGTWVLKTDE